MKLYHAASPKYQAGDDLYSLRALIDAGVVTEAGALDGIMARWDMDQSDAERYLFSDGDLISFTPDLNEARYIRDEFNGGAGLLLCWDTERFSPLEWGCALLTNSERYPALSNRLPGECLSILE